MNYASIKYNDIANGTGVRTTLFVSGCTHHCFNCFNAIAWDFKYGEPFTEEVENQILESLKPDYITGLTLLGGEPMEKVNQLGLISFLRKVHEQFPNKTIWCYTGYLWEDLLPGGKVHTEVTEEILSYLEILVDGEYLDAQRDITLIFKGSKNQRTIDVAKTLESGFVIERELQKGTIEK